MRPSAIVTGAGSGIGRATALVLARAGYDLVVVGRRADVLAKAVADIVECGAAAEPFVGDVGDRRIAEGMVDFCVKRFGRIDVIVNNAGVAPLIPIGETAAIIEESFRVNALGPAWTIARAWPHFAGQLSGCVVNVSTLGTKDPFPGFFAYAASKASVNLMARSCANEGAKIGVRAFCVAPGAVETSMLRSLFDAEAIPAAECLSPEQVARVIYDCIRGERDAENGQTIFLVK